MTVKLFDSELKVMDVLWRDGDRTAREIAGILGEEIGWNTNTTYTVIKKCVAKGAIRRSEPGFQCHALISKTEVQAAETEALIGKLFDGLQQERVGLVVFAGEPKVQLPITSDYRMAQAFAKRISTSLVGEQGTAVGKALQQAMLAFSSQSEKSRVIVLITDGENHEDDALEAARMAKEQGIRIYTIGIGTPEGAPIRVGGDFVKDEKGEMVVSKLDERMLEQIAAITDGAYVRATKQSIGLDEIVRSINDMEKSELSTVRFEEYNEQYQYLVAAALLLLLLETAILGRRNPRLQRFNIFREDRSPDNA